MSNFPNTQTIIEAFSYVQRTLLQNGGEFSANPMQSFRRRSEHIKRVFFWCKRLLKNEIELRADPTLIYYSALFHDAGYNDRGIPHEELGAEIFMHFAEENMFPNILTSNIADIIRRHSRKEALHNPATPIEQLLVMEADLLDEEGALGIVIDCMTFVKQNPNIGEDYVSLLSYLRKYAGEILHCLPMVTPYAAYCWKMKQQMVRSFLQAMEEDLFLKIGDSLA